MAVAIQASWLRSLAKTAKGKIRDRILATPFARDVFLYHWNFLGRTGACRGVYSTYREAEIACKASGHAGFNDHLFHAPQIVGEPILVRDRDYPILLWLASCLNESTQILNLGGNAGFEYFTYGQFLHYPPGLRWLVWELPYAVKFGDHLAHTLDAPGLAFTTRLEDGSGADILLACGALQYFEQDLATCLKRLRTRPPRLFINRVALYEGETFYTVQSTFGSVTPYRIQNRQELIDSLADLGYHVVDCWYEEREVVIPFHPTRRVQKFYGFYFVSNDLVEPDWQTSAVATAAKVVSEISYA